MRNHGRTTENGPVCSFYFSDDDFQEALQDVNRGNCLYGGEGVTEAEDPPKTKEEEA